MATLDVRAEIVFVKQVIKFLQIKVNLSILVNKNKIRVPVLANNMANYERTSHIDASHHFVRNNVEDGIVQFRLCL